MYSYCKRYDLAFRFNFPLILLLAFTSFAAPAQQQQNSNDTIRLDTLTGVPDSLGRESQAGDEEVPNEEEYPINFLKMPDAGSVADSLLLRRIPDSVVAKLKQDAAFWYADYDFKKTRLPESSSRVPVIQQKWFEVLLWIIIIGGFSFFIMWYLAGSNIGLFRKKHKYIDTADEDAGTEDIFRINYGKEIENAIMNGNHRLAVRLMYLQLLKKLSEKNVIRYKQESTNYDYLLQLQSSDFYLDFFRVTRNYEYSWYGLFDIDAVAFGIIKNDFKNFAQKLDVN